MAGYGTAPFGTAPYGVGTPSTTAGNAGSLLNDTSGATQGSRYINPRTRQYEFDANGRFKGQQNTQSLVQLALLTVLASSSVPGLGETLPSGVIGTNFVKSRKSAISDALSDLVKAKLISIVSIDVDTTRRPVFTVIRWTDLTTGIEQQTQI